MRKGIAEIANCSDYRGDWGIRGVSRGVIEEIHEHFEFKKNIHSFPSGIKFFILKDLNLNCIFKVNLSNLNF